MLTTTVFILLLFCVVVLVRFIHVEHDLLEAENKRLKKLLEDVVK